ncbi:MAG: YdeI/OmpD-associated family protein [Paracoccus sp.]|nr:YdeI/OmpD-associated family protein [Paracoccus sp. (in: a-proteobacteria)]
MSDTTDKLSEHFAQIEDWRDEILTLRALLQDSPLTEDFKWFAPVYTYEDHNVCILWAFKDRCTLGFFKGVLLKDPLGILTPPGPNSRSSRTVDFTDTAQIARLAPALRAYIDEAIEIEKAGLRVIFAKDDLAYPEELVERLEEDSELQSAFEALTPGRRRGWLLHFSTAKLPLTRAARVDRAIPRILAGKGMHDR